MTTSPAFRRGTVGSVFSDLSEVFWIMITGVATFFGIQQRLKTGLPGQFSARIT